ncbi:hypothetical protein HMPREF9334_00606 [Selenomonas infelix ATCC 43532]|uniref:Uncharacterized protein n=1 Tax=Selenomonas infelix ATCC 43532 TaxID=679201 RepID=G5GMX5_9FIRM|nr:hypothetical protein [Selenomonas infelix]EHG21903.1 hypothetical protein HMPREF9334_00606 [Selenomonas infelix ATCC 43532]
MIREAQLLRGIIFGDRNTDEYVYMPASEIGIENPLYVYEEGGSRRDIDLAEALHLIRVRDLRPTIHPLLGRTSC